jgi:hypothetical protein
MGTFYPNEQGVKVTDTLYTYRTQAERGNLQWALEPQVRRASFQHNPYGQLVGRDGI